MKSFQRLILIAVIGTYLVILAGAVVRGTGSGLGCPDWPRCFGQWIPPMDISELPENYKEVYKIAGKTIADFDPFKTWTEYLNRLLGVFLGISIVALFVKSFSLREQEKNLTWYCAGLLFLVMIQGGVGALVVSTHLKPFLITIHMFLAIVLLFGLLYLQKYCKDFDNIAVVSKVDQKALTYSKVLASLAFVQILLGTQVRQQVDHLMRDTESATVFTVIQQLNWIFYVHRTFSLVIIGVFIMLLTYLHRSQYDRSAFFLTLSAFFSVMGNVTSGIMLNYYNFPSSAQPPHLFFGVMTIGFLFTLYLNVKGSLLEE